jgi:NCAIR mutase (PurE)-related protein
MIKGTVIFINENDLRKNTKEQPTIEDRMELMGDDLKTYQSADVVIYRDNEVVKNKYGKVGIITRKKV